MEVVNVIASGGFGRVERVVLDDGTQAARKVFSPHKAMLDAVGHDKLTRRFRREVKYQSTLPSDLFIPVLTADLDEDTPSFIMPLADRSLAQEIAESRKAGRVPFDALLQVLESLEWLHKHDFVHRDVKPENALLHEGRWKLSDLGLILPPTDKTERFTTVHGFFTEMYCAPEQRRDFREASLASDIYSFGCILHDVYGGTARVPYQQAISKVPMGVVIERCTALDPKNRFRSIDGLRDALVTIHATPSDMQATPQAKEWVTRIEAGQINEPDHVRDLSRFLMQAESPNDVWPVYAALSEDVFQALYKVDAEKWVELAKLYCAWAHGGFDFDYCDVVVRRLQQLFGLGSVGVRAEAALAAAELGRSHNRWFVMWRVVEMCGKSIDEPTAQRLVIEILASEAQANLVACAEVIGNTIDVYHPKIAALLAAPKVP